MAHSTGSRVAAEWFGIGERKKHPVMPCPAAAGATGADLANMVNEAALLAGRANKGARRAALTYTLSAAEASCAARSAERSQGPEGLSCHLPHARSNLDPVAVIGCTEYTCVYEGE